MEDKEMTVSKLPWTLAEENQAPSKRTNSKIEIPQNFKEKYIEFYERKITFKDLLNEFGVSASTMRRWRDSLSLPPVPAENRRVMKALIPKGFKESYLKCIKSNKNLKELEKIYNIKSSTILKWASYLKLPVPFKQETIIQPINTVSTEVKSIASTEVKGYPKILLNIIFEFLKYQLSFKIEKISY